MDTLTQVVTLNADTPIYCANARGFANEQVYLPVLPGYADAAARAVEANRELSDRENHKGHYSVVRFGDLPNSQRYAILERWSGESTDALEYAYGGWEKAK